MCWPLGLFLRHIQIRHLEDYKKKFPQHSCKHVQPLEKIVFEGTHYGHILGQLYKWIHIVFGLNSTRRTSIDPLSQQLSN